MQQFQQFFEGFLRQFGNFLPGVLGALVILILGWIIAKFLGGLTTKLMRKTNLDNKLFKGSSSVVSPEKFIGKLVYYLVMLMVLMVVLEKLGIYNVLEPLKDMLGEFVAFIPNLVAAGIIGFVGYMLANIVSELTGFAGGVIDNFSTRMGFSTSLDLGKIVKQLVFIIVFIPILIVAFDTLGLEAISGPAKEMLSTFINAIPNILVAAMIIGLFYVIGKYISTIGAELLKSIGTDDMSTKLGLGQFIGERTSLSNVIAKVGFFFLMFTGITTASDKLGFNTLTTTMNDLLELSGHIFFGLIVMGVGGYVANLAYKALSQTKGNEFLASLARIAILGLFLAIALRTMGIANDIVNLAFGLTLGAVAVAVALSFGLGGREAAGKQMEHILRKFRKED